ncbi:hypothetical protein O181_101726 [Austropuccinia psidii MF-1]|uniref:Uncharacterized protein n=1 Tax=Austropuccinia psidii MF-1 TaxID=1389203 RepID=A0A9Q3PIX6_9BASI|nr:hypothetical protein [Austropuccinia psidii MF-1]
MPVQHSPPARQTRSQAVLTPTPRAPLDSTPAVPPLRTPLDRGHHMEGATPSRKEEGQEVKTSKIPNWHQEPPLPIIIEEEEE